MNNLGWAKEGFRAVSFLLVCATCAGGVSAATVGSYAVLKGNAYQQHSSVDADPINHPSANGYYSFQPYVRGTGLSQATVTTPQRVLTLAPAAPGTLFFSQDGLGHFWISDGLPHLASTIGSGQFEFSIEGGAQTATLELGAADFPESIPHAYPFPGFQHYTGSGFFWDTPTPYLGGDLEVSWRPWVNPGPNDIIQIAIARFDPAGVETVFVTPEPGESGAIPATATSFTIPEAALNPNNQRYFMYIRFLRVTQLDQTSIPGARGYAGFFTETEFYLKTGDSWYGQPHPDEQAPTLVSFPPEGTPLLRQLPSATFEFSEAMAQTPLVEFNPAIPVSSVYWSSWEQSQLIVRLGSYPYDTTIQWTISGGADMAGNPVAERTGTFKTPSKPTYKWETPEYLTGGELQYQLVTDYGTTAIIEPSSDLKTWTPISTNQVVGGKVTVGLAPVPAGAVFIRSRTPKLP